MSTGVYSSNGTSLMFRADGTKCAQIDLTGMNIGPNAGTGNVGSATSAALSFGAAGTGFYTSSTVGPNVVYLNASTEAVKRVAFSASGIQLSTGQYLAPVQSDMSKPSYAFADDPNTGFNSDAADTLSLVAGGTEALRFTTTGATVMSKFAYVAVGSGVSDCHVQLGSGDTDTGIHNGSGNQLYLVAAATSLSFNTSFFSYIPTIPLRCHPGSASLPVIAFGSEPSSGIYQPAVGQVGLSVLGTTALLAKSTSVALPLGCTLGSDTSSLAIYSSGTTTPDMQQNGTSFTGQSHVCTWVQLGKIVMMDIKLGWGTRPGSTGAITILNLLPVAPADTVYTSFITNEVSTGDSFTSNNLYFQLSGTTATGYFMFGGTVSSTFGSTVFSNTARALEFSLTYIAA